MSERDAEPRDESTTIEPAPAAYKRLGLVALLYAYRAIASLVITLPFVAALGGATASYPRHQAELFDDGGVMLLESLRHMRRALPAVLWSGGSIAILAAAIGLLPLGMLIAALDRKGRAPIASLLSRAWSHAGTFAMIYGLAFAARIVSASILLLLGGKLVNATRLVPPAEDIAGVTLIALIFLVISILGVLADLAYVAAVRGHRGLYDAAATSLQTARSSPLRAFFGWLSRAALGFSCLAFAAWLAPSGKSTTGPAVLFGFALHQAALFASTYARASWLAAAMRLVDRRRDQ